MLLAGLVLVLSACTGSPTPAGEEPSQACADEPTRPLVAADVKRVLKRHGFPVRRAREEAICEGPAGERMPVSLSNYDQDEDTPFVSCGLRRAPIWGWRLDEDLDAPPSSPIFSGEKAEFSYANLECAIYPAGEQGHEQVRRFQHAVRELVAIARARRS